MGQQVLILNVTRMGDLVQTVPLVSRLRREWPDVAVDLVVDEQLAPMAELLPGLRRVLTRDFFGLAAQSASMTSNGTALAPDLAVWAQPLAAVGYDRVINLTFTRWSGILAQMIGAPDVRGAKATRNGGTIIGNAWYTYFVDLRHFRRLNRFNVADLYALGGSGPGPHQPIRLAVSSETDEWARRFVHTTGQEPVRIAVQVGAGNQVKAWRPDYFGQTMAAVSRLATVAFVLIGTGEEVGVVAQAVAAYQAAGGSATLCNAVGQTSLTQLAALLGRCRLFLTNDTGPMQVAVGVGTPVIDLSVGHVDFHETGPYGPGHWVVQPTLGCAPCDYAQACSHHACKDQVAPEELAGLCLHALGLGPFPSAWTGVRVYESGLDSDGLGCYGLKAGQEDAISDWYGRFWRRYWYELHTGTPSRIHVQGPPPDLLLQQEYFRQMAPSLEDALSQAELIARLACQGPVTDAIKEAQAGLTALRQEVLATALQSWAFGPATVIFMRDLQNSEALTMTVPAAQQAQIYKDWRNRIHGIMKILSGNHMMPLAGIGKSGSW